MSINLIDAEPGQLAQILDVGSKPSQMWTDSELGLMLNHQLDAPLFMDLSGVPRMEGASSAGACDDPSFRTLRFADVFFDQGSVEVLRLIKDYAKGSMIGKADEALPESIGLMLYYLAIAAALVQHGVKITQLSDKELAEGLTWASDQSWASKPAHALLENGRRSLDREARAR